MLGFNWSLNDERETETLQVVAYLGERIKRDYRAGTYFYPVSFDIRLSPFSVSPQSRLFFFRIARYHSSGAQQLLRD